MRKILKASLCAASLTLFASPAMAAHELPPGDTLSPFAGGGNGGGAGNLAVNTGIGGLLADTGNQFLSTSVAGTTLNTRLRAAVYQGPVGFLDFLYQVTNLATSNTSVKDLSFASFAGFDLSSTPALGAWQTLNAFGVFGAGTEAADSANRTADGSVLGASFQTTAFGDANAGANALLNPGETSSIIQFRVAATNFRPGTFGVLNGVSVTGNGWAPAAPVPEPATWALMLLGFGMLGYGLRRRPKVATRVNFAMS